MCSQSPHAHAIRTVVTRVNVHFQQRAHKNRKSGRSVSSLDPGHTLFSFFFLPSEVRESAAGKCRVVPPRQGHRREAQFGVDGSVVPYRPAAVLSEGTGVDVSACATHTKA